MLAWSTYAITTGNRWAAAAAAAFGLVAICSRRPTKTVAIPEPSVRPVHGVRVLGRALYDQDADESIR
jgi:cobalamin biosynthesis protein CbiD